MTDVFAPSFNSALQVRWNLAGGTSRCPSRAPRAFGLTEATPADRSSRERMAHKMRAMEWESLMILLAPGNPIEELDDERVVDV